MTKFMRENKSSQYSGIVFARDLLSIRLTIPIASVFGIIAAIFHKCKLARVAISKISDAAHSGIMIIINIIIAIIMGEMLAIIEVAHESKILRYIHKSLKPIELCYSR